MVSDSQQSDTTYVVDAENAAEMARLHRQGRLLTQHMGGVFPASIDLSSIRHVLDIACGPGEWVLATASMYPEMQVTGIDISHIMIAYAIAQAQQQEMKNATFQIMSAQEQLAFPDNAFDLVNARFLFAFMTPDQWPKLMQECMRITRPGGIILLTESESPLTNSAATERLCALSVEAMKRAGLLFSPDGRHVGITPMLGKFFRNAGCINIQYKSHVIDCSAGTQAYQDVFNDFMAGYKLVQPYLVKMDVTTQEEVEGLYQRLLEEQQSPDFCEVWFYLSVWGQKPEEEAS